MIHPPEIRGDGKHLCQVCHQTAAIHISPLPGQKSTTHDEGIDLCPTHAAQMTIGAMLSIGEVEELAQVLMSFSDEIDRALGES